MLIINTLHRNETGAYKEWKKVFGNRNDFISTRGVINAKIVNTNILRNQSQSNAIS
jgi:hypothetical protein